MSESITPRLANSNAVKASNSWLLCRLVIVFILAVGLSGCRLNLPINKEAAPTQTPSSAASPSPSPLSGVPAQAPTGYPPPAVEPQTAPTGYPGPAVIVPETANPYPVPEEPQSVQATATQPSVADATLTLSVQPYPLPATSAATEVSETAYPGPQAAATATIPPLTYPGPQASPTSGQPLEQATPTTLSYPGPALTLTPQPLASQTPVLNLAGTPTGTIVVVSPSPTLSPTVVRTVFKPSDPAEFTLISDKPRLITFYADWAPDSEAMAPVIYNLEGRYGDRVAFVYLNLDDTANNIFKEMLKSQLPPAFFLLSPQGSVIRLWSGRVTFDELDLAIRSISP